MEKFRERPVSPDRSPENWDFPGTPILEFPDVNRVQNYGSPLFIDMSLELDVYNRIELAREVSHGKALLA